MFDTTRDESSHAFDLAEFIDEYSPLFVVMGVFGALAIYISQSATASTPDAELVVKTGFVSAFGLALLMFLLIYLKLIEEFGDWHTFYRAHFRLVNAPLALFSLFSTMLVLSLTFALTQREPVVLLLLLVATVGVGLGIFTRVMFAVGHRVPSTAIWRISTLFFISLGMLVLTFYLRTRVLAQFETNTIQTLSLSDPVPVAITVLTLLTVTVSSFSAIGILSAAIAVPVVIIDKIRGKSPYDGAGE